MSARFTTKAPPKIDETIDLKSGFVIPPFGDAHCHHFDGTYGLQELINTYQKDGIFYAQTLCNPAKSGLEARPLLNLPSSIDVIQAQACLTGNNSHPMDTYEGLALGYYSFQQQEAHRKQVRDSRLQENNAYFIIDNREDLQNKWQTYLDAKPQILKVILSHSENYARRKAQSGNKGGIDPSLLPEIVNRAHRVGLRVAAHVDSAFDYHAALISGVDVMAHLPGYYYGADDIDAEYTLSEADIALTKMRGVVVIPASNLIDLMDGGGGGSLEQREKAKK